MKLMVLSDFGLVHKQSTVACDLWVLFDRMIVMIGTKFSESVRRRKVKVKVKVLTVGARAVCVHLYIMHPAVFHVLVRPLSPLLSTPICMHAAKPE